MLKAKNNRLEGAKVKALRGKRDGVTGEDLIIRATRGQKEVIFELYLFPFTKDPPWFLYLFFIAYLYVDREPLLFRLQTDIQWTISMQ